MTEIDKIIYSKLKSKFSDKLERRDYFKLEEKRPDLFKGKGNNSGIMFLVDIDDCHYIDINLLKAPKWTNPSRNTVKMVLRRGDDEIIDFKTIDFSEDQLYAFLSLVDEYISLNDRLNKFSRGIIPEDIKRNGKIEKILT